MCAVGVAFPRLPVRNPCRELGLGFRERTIDPREDAESGATIGEPAVLTI